jgi:tetratricopeptide (TPR) repeat protein
MALQEFGEASSDFEKSIELGKDDIDLYYDLGICLISKGDVDEGVAKLGYVIDTDDSPELTEAAQNILLAMSQEE